MYRYFLLVCCLLGAFSRVWAEGGLPGLTWDSLTKEYSSKRGETNVLLTFYFTNKTSEPIQITAAKPSCHCTVLKDLELPKKVLPGEGGPLTVDVDIILKTGTLHKTIAIETDHGTNSLSVDVHLPIPTMREKNQLAAFVDRQAVFKGDCAQCHSVPAANKMGEALFTAACAICHETEHRADMVPSLAALKTPADQNYWQQWIRMGKPGTFMPGFEKKYGGPLTQEQISSLVEYLSARFPERKMSSGKPILPLD